MVGANLSRSHRNKYVCDRCLHYFLSRDKLAAHEAQCSLLNDTYLLEFPHPEKSVIHFKNLKYKERVPFIIYVDCECLLLPEETNEQDCKTMVTHKHEMYSIGFYLKCSYNDHFSKYRSYRGPAAARWFANELKDISNQVNQLYQMAMPMEKLSTQQEDAHRFASFCHICEQKFDENDVRVRDHCHLTGKYRGPAHEICNINYQDSRVIPVVFHNLSGYDAHFIVSDISNTFPGCVKILPLAKDKYISFTKYVDGIDIKLRFID